MRTALVEEYIFIFRAAFRFLFALVVFVFEWFFVSAPKINRDATFPSLLLMLQNI